jgi:uncharacterized protein YcbK (DUF882 family)
MTVDREFWIKIPHFKQNEFTCKCGCEHNNISHDLVERLNQARYIAQTPFKINSACRCAKHNHTVNGSVGSAHLKGKAVDIHIDSSSSRFKILQALTACGFKRLGVYENFIHVDIDESKTKNVIWYK